MDVAVCPDQARNIVIFILRKKIIVCVCQLYTLINTKTISRSNAGRIIIYYMILIELRKTTLRGGIKCNFNFSVSPSKRGGRVDDDDDYNNNNGCHYYYGVRKCKIILDDNIMYVGFIVGPGTDGGGTNRSTMTRRGRDAGKRNTGSTVL